MAYNERPFDNPLNWSFRVGRLFAIDIRVHVAFVLCAVVLVWMELPKDGPESGPPIGKVLVDALGIYALLFVVVLLHEFGHCFGARKMGGEADEILLWPLGGLASVKPPHTAAAHMVTTLAGPMVNVIICAVCSMVLVLWLGTLWAVPWNPLHPMLPVDHTLILSTPQLWVIRFFGISYFILLINLLPIFPFDGGRIVQAWLWPKKGYGRSMQIATGTGMIGAVLIGLFALFQDQSWLLLMIAVFGYVTCWQTRRMLREFGEFELSEIGSEFSQGYTFGGADDDGEEGKPGFFARRRARIEAVKAEREQQRSKEHEEAVERALRKVTEQGLASLTPKERRVLEEETKRQQSQQS